MIKQNKVKSDPDNYIFINYLSRRNFIKIMSVMSAAIFSSCSDIRMLFNLVPDKYKDDRDLIERTLRSFAVTVIPGANEDDINLIKIYTDEFYPFHKFCNYFVYDLCKRSKYLYGEENFYNLSSKKRNYVIKNATGNGEDADTIRLYEFAVFVTQVSFYGGIYDDGKGCALIEFKGNRSGNKPEEKYYPDNSFYLAREITKEGNFN